MSREPAYKFIDTLPLPICSTSLNKYLLSTMGLVRRYSEINRSAKEEAANRGDDRREKSWFTKRKVYGAPACCSGTKMAMRKRREQGERAPQSTFPSRGARVSVETLILAGPRTGASWDEATCQPSRTPFVPRCLCPVLTSPTEWGPKMHPETQPLSRRAHSYSILALCFSTSVIFADDYIVGMLARPQPRTESRRDSRASRSIAL